MRENNSGSLIKITLIIAAVAAVSVFTPVRDTAPVSAVRNVLFRAIYPIQYISFKTVSFFSYAGKSLISLRGAQKENERLKKELAAQRIVTDLFTELIGENRRLKGLVGFKDRNQYGLRLVPAEVISRSQSSWFKCVVVDKGTSEGIKQGKAVVSPKGLVGRVIEVYPHSCKVLLLIDENSYVSVSIPRSSEIGVMAGRGAQQPLLKYISSTSDVRDGDTAVTSGISDYFPKGIPVGRIRETRKKDLELFRDLTIEPEADFSDLRSVFIVR